MDNVWQLISMSLRNTGAQGKNISFSISQMGGSPM